MKHPQKSRVANRFWRPEQPFNELPTLPPAVKLETRAILKQCIEARAALAELKQAAELTVGQLEFDGSIPFIVLKTTDEKSREGNSLPLRADLADDLRN